jgi:hypothetical protein
MRDEATSEMGSNGWQMIGLYGIHGPTNLAPFFLQSQLKSRRPFVIYDITGTNMMRADAPSKVAASGHGGKEKESRGMAWRPELVKPERAHNESYH